MIDISVEVTNNLPVGVAIALDQGGANIGVSSSPLAKIACQSAAANIAAALQPIVAVAVS